MTIQQMFVAFTCFLLATQQVTAVVNKSKSANVEETSTVKNVTSTSPKVADSVVAGTETEAKRREAPVLTLSDTYGLPLTGGDSFDSYVPTGPSNPTLPIPVYGVPDTSSNNIVYPAPPPDIPPPLPAPIYGAPSPAFGFSQIAQGIDSLGGPHVNHFIPPPPPAKFGLPNKPPKNFIGPAYHGKPVRPRPQYGVPSKPIFVPKPKPKPIYGPPPKLFTPHKNFKQQQVTILTAPSADYGIPNLNGPAVGPHSAPIGNYGPPEPISHGPPQPILHGPPQSISHGPPQGISHGPPHAISHGPPHPGAPAPPTPPDIKYDGWQPIPGLVSRPPSDSYGVPEGTHHGTGDLHLNIDFTPPPAGHGFGHGLSHSANVGYSSPQKGLSDSYGAPLNAVTGSGAIDSSSGDAHHDDQSLSLGLSAAGINGQNHLSVIKSIGYELFPNSGSVNHISDSYSSPPSNSYSPNGPYAAAHSYKTNGLSSSHFGGSVKGQNSHFHNSHSSHHHHNHHHHSHGHSSPIGLIPPSGIYGAPPSGHYGTPLLSKPSTQYGPPLNALKINPPKHPVIFREPVPVGLIESIGQQTAHKDAHGIINHAHSFSNGPTYVPPPVPDITKVVREEEPPLPSHLYSLPNPTSVVSFQDVGHASLPDVHSISLNSNQFSGVHAQALTSYTAPLASIESSYSLPLHVGPGYSVGLDNAHSGGITVGIDNSLAPLSIDLTSSTTNVGNSFAHLPHTVGYQNGHDCNSHGSQPLPSLTYGVPSANSYTASLASLTTNIGGGYQPPVPSGLYSVPDLQSEHSKKVPNVVPPNSIEDSSQGKNYGKSLAQNFGPNSELIKSESIDINNIPVKGALGSYTLQIQPAGSLGNVKSSAEHVSHAQVLNDGLLQSILAAIERPDRKDANILGQPLSQFKPDQDSEPEAQHSVTHEVVVPAPVTESTGSSTPEPESETEASLRLIENNEIALYFNNNLKDEEASDKNSTESDVRNGQQYGSYVSFKTPNASFAYRNVASDKSQETEEKD